MAVMGRTRLALSVAVGFGLLGLTPLGLRGASAGDTEWNPYSAPAAVVATARPLPVSPFVSAETIAARNGLTYQDGGTFVLLSNTDSRVRMYPGTNRISIDGEEIELKGQIQRVGASVVLPAPGAAFVESRIRRERGHVAALRAEYAPPPATTMRPASAPVTTASVPARAPTRPVPSGAISSSGVSPEPGWIPVGVTERPWKWIVIHHSDDNSGNAAKYNAQHLAQGWENGLGYDFVVGNGSMSGDGQIEVAHAKTADNCYNELGIGIVLVGDFEHGSTRPTAAQMSALVRLCRFLMARYGISPENVRGHCDCKPTACPGRHFPWADLRARLAAGR
jgi:N-acetylmuramoyl-L-alanine amidase